MPAKVLPTDQSSLERLWQVADRFLAALEPVRQQVNAVTKSSAKLLDADLTDYSFLEKTHQSLEQKVADGFPPYQLLMDYIEPLNIATSQASPAATHRLNELIERAMATHDDRECHALLCSLVIAEQRDAIDAFVNRIHDLQSRITKEITDLTSRSNNNRSAGVAVQPSATEATRPPASADEPQTGESSPASPKVKPKRSTEKGEAQAKLIAALTAHHKYSDGGCHEKQPIGNNELARRADVDRASALAFFTSRFGGHAQYKTTCRRDFGVILDVLKLLNREFSMRDLYGASPPNESERDG